MRDGNADIVTPVLEIGGTHVTAALVDLDHDEVRERRRFSLDPHASRIELIGAFAAAGRSLPGSGRGEWGIAVPGPFDYARGIGDFRGVGKFDALHGVDVRSELAAGLGAPADRITFINDADAFARGEWRLRGHSTGRCVVLTLGTGVGSSFLVDGVPQHSGPGVPPNGHVYALSHRGRPLEQAVSRAAIMDAYAVTSRERVDVKLIAERARVGDDAARAAFEDAFRGLGEALGPTIEAFAARLLLVGGSIAGAWDLIEEPLLAGLRSAMPTSMLPAVRRAPDGEEAALLGAALATRSPA